VLGAERARRAVRGSEGGSEGVSCAAFERAGQGSAPQFTHGWAPRCAQRILQPSAPGHTSLMEAALRYAIQAPAPLASATSGPVKPERSLHKSVRPCCWSATGFYVSRKHTAVAQTAFCFLSAIALGQESPSFAPCGEGEARGEAAARAGCSLGRMVTGGVPCYEIPALNADKGGYQWRNWSAECGSLGSAVRLASLDPGEPLESGRAGVKKRKTKKEKRGLLLSPSRYLLGLACYHV